MVPSRTPGGHRRIRAFCMAPWCRMRMEPLTPLRSQRPGHHSSAGRHTLLPIATRLADHTPVPVQSPIEVLLHRALQCPGCTAFLPGLEVVGLALG